MLKKSLKELILTNNLKRIAAAMKSLIYISIFLLVGACATQSHKEKIAAIKSSIEVVNPELIDQYANSITQDELKSHMFVFASDEFQGRATGTTGQKLAANFIMNYYISEKIGPAYSNGNYFQSIPGSYFGGEFRDSENVVAFIEGNDKANEVLVLSAHYDHEGIDKEGQVFYGADDNGSGTVALFEMAQAFQTAKENGHGPRRSILFLHTTAEEIGLQGSKYYTENPAVPLSNTIANLNIDMIGRVDRPHQTSEISDYVYLIGSDRISNELHFISEAINEQFINLQLNYKFNDSGDRNRYFYRSDHYNFARHNIPVIFYFNGVHEDYSKITDTPDKIDYDLLTKRTRLIFGTAWQLANQETRVKVDKS